jgi:phosphoribosylglycinamide formyltransferase-1
MKKIAVLFSGSGTNFKYILENLHKSKLEVVLALTNNPDAGGILYAKEYKIPLIIRATKSYTSRKMFDKTIVDDIKNSGAELVVLAGFMRILTPTFTSNVNAINLHPSLLPRHKGLNAIEKSYNDSHKEGGVTVHHVTSELDGGEIIVQKSINKGSLDFNEYNQLIRKIEKEALAEAILKVLN